MKATFWPGAILKYSAAPAESGMLFVVAVGLEPNAIAD